MPAILNILIGLAAKLGTARFLSRVSVLTAWEAARRTKPVFDDEIVKAAADELGVKLPQDDRNPDSFG